MSITPIWQYTKRPDGKIAIALDNNVWNFLFDRELNLALELPSDEFVISIPREIEIETEAIPANNLKAALREYSPDNSRLWHQDDLGVWVCSGRPRSAKTWGFDQGKWQSQTEREFYAAIREQYLVGRREMGSQLTGNEGDAAVAAQSFLSIVLTCESRRINGPLRFAAEHGGAILYLDGFDRSGLPLKEYIVAFYQQL